MFTLRHSGVLLLNVKSGIGNCLDMSFEKFWGELTVWLKSERLIRNWTADHGYLPKGNFTAVYKGQDYVECEVPDAMNIQRVPKEDFRFISDNWQKYLEKRIRRSELRDRSRFTKYTISILHQYQHPM